MNKSLEEITHIKQSLIAQAAQMVIAFNIATRALADARVLGATVLSPELKEQARTSELAARDARWLAIEAAYTMLSVNLQATLDVMLKQAPAQERPDASAVQAAPAAPDAAPDFPTPIHDALEEELRGKQSQLAQAGQEAVDKAKREQENP